MTTITKGSKTGSAVGSTRFGRGPWLVLAAIVAVLAVIGAWFLFGGDDTPTIEFEGEAADYDGPTTFDAGEVTFVFDASEYEPGVMMIIGALNDDSITLDEIKTYAAENPASSDVPAFIESFEIVALTAQDPDDRVIERTFDLEGGKRYLLTANTSPGDTDRVFPAAIIEVE